MRLFTLLPGQRAKHLHSPLVNNSMNMFVLYFCMKLDIHHVTDISVFSQPHPRSTKVIKRRCTKLNKNRDLSQISYARNVSIMLLSMNLLFVFTMLKNFKPGSQNRLNTRRQVVCQIVSMHHLSFQRNWFCDLKSVFCARFGKGSPDVYMQV